MAGESIEKREFSARKFMVIIFCSTYSLCIISFCVLAVRKLISVETLLALFGGFSTMVLLINEWYFKREDRKTENGGLQK